MTKSYVIDDDLLMRDAGQITSSAASQVASADKIIDMGDGFVEGVVIVDPSEIDFTVADEKYDVDLQLSNVAVMTSAVVVKCSLKLGDARDGMNDDTTVDKRRTLEFNNRVADTTYRYARLFEIMSGTDPILDFVAYMTKNPQRT
ncbi:MAG: hypothetical protein FVQ84_08485 [Planctomycetes bacterium]|nr:hypothetical protein [Planctomycetota bacterium]